VTSALDALRANFPRARSYGYYLWAFVAPASTLFLAVVTNALASRSLGPAGFGTFALTVSVLTLLGIAVGFGMPTSLVRFCVRFSDTDLAKRVPYQAAAWTVVLGAALVTAVVGAAAEVMVGDRIRIWIPAHAGAAVIAGALGTALIEMAGAEAQIRLDFRRYSITVQLGGALRLLGVGLGLFMARGSVMAALYGYSLGSLTAGVVMSGPSLLRNARVLYQSRGRVLQTARPLGRFALPVVASTFVIAAIGYVDMLVIAPFASTADLGVYAAGVRLTAVQSTIIAGLATIALPLASRAANEGWEHRFSSRVLLLCGVLGLVVTASLVLFSVPLVRAVYGRHYAASAVLFAILSSGLLLNFVGNPLSQLLYAHGAPQVLFLAHALQLLALLVGLPLVAENWHMTGVALFRSIVNITIVSLVIVAVLRGWGVRKRASVSDT
jgi:O-antigen/teichoic acid export membrane protein